MNELQPQGVVKTVTNPQANKDGKYVVDMIIPEKDGVALASHLVLTIDAAKEQDGIDLLFQPSGLRTRFDQVTFEIVSNLNTKVNIYTLIEPKHVDDYTQAPMSELSVEANKPMVFTAMKHGDAIVFSEDNIGRVLCRPAPENGSTPQAEEFVEAER